MLKRTFSAEIRAIRQGMQESPPPAPSGTTVREWFAGLALASHVIMKDIPVELRAQEAVRIADELIKALRAPKVPTLESMASPTADEMLQWEGKIEEDRVKKERQSRATVPPFRALKSPPSSRTPTTKFGAVLPPPSVEGDRQSRPTIPPPVITEKKSSPLPGFPRSNRYIYLNGSTDTES